MDYSEKLNQKISNIMKQGFLRINPPPLGNIFDVLGEKLKTIYTPGMKFLLNIGNICNLILRI